MPFCQDCGTQVGETDRSCSSCGRALTVAEAPRIDRIALLAGYATGQGRARFLRVALGAAAALTFVQAVSTLMQVSLLYRLRDGRATFAELEASDERQALVGTLMLLALLVASIVWLMWQHRAQKNLQLLGARTRFTPGWAVGWWLIPFANLWMPYQTVRELYTTSLPEPDGSRARSAPLLGWWWAAYLLGTILSAFPGGINELPSIDELITTGWLGVIGRLLQAGAALLAMRIVADVMRGQQRLADQFADVRG